MVVADAGMLSAANLNRLEDAGFGFIVGSRTSSAPYDPTGVTVRRIVRALRPLRDVTITIDGHELTATTPPTGEAADIIAALRPGVGH